MIPLFAAYVIWERRAHLARIPCQPTWWGLLVGLGGLATLFLGLLGAELFLTRTSLLLVVAGLLLWLHGWQMLRALVFPLAVFLLMIPIPMVIYNQIVFPLQLLASETATFCLQQLYIMPVLREGNVLLLPNARLEVAEACSGIRSLMSLLTIAIIYGYFAERRNWMRVLLCLFIVPIAVLSNAARVMFAAVGSQYWGEAVVEGTPHLVSGLVLFVVATVSLVAVHALLGRTGFQLPVSRFQKDRSSAPGSGNGNGKRVFLAVGILLAAALAVHALPHGRSMPLRLPLRSLPLQTENWQATELQLEPRIEAAAGVDDYLLRVYQGPGAPPLGLYVGYYASQRTGDTIHSPKNCLPGGGWQPVAARHVALRRPDGQTAPINEYIIEKEGQRQVVLYWYQSHGRMIASEYWAKFYMVWDAICLNRTDGALVRITAAVAGDETEARQRALQFAEKVLPELNRIIPR